MMAAGGSNVGQPIQARLTWADYEQLPEDGNRYEVLEGELVMTPAPDYVHQCVSMNLSVLLDTWRRSSGLAGRMLAAPFDVVLADDTIVQPDLIYLSSTTRELLHRGRLCGVPDVAIEIHHTERAARDRVAKLQIYARFAIPEYWLVNIDSRTVTILLHREGGYETLATGTGQTPLASRVLEGLVVTPAEVFEGI